MGPWHVLKVKPRHERIIADTLSANGFEPFVPITTETRVWSDRVKKVGVQLFPGYVFCRFVREQRTAVLRTPGVLSVVSFGKYPAVVPDEEVEAVRSVVRSGLPARTRPYVQLGDRVTVEQGCLAGVSGLLVREKGTWRVVVSVTILQRSVEVEIDRSMISSRAEEWLQEEPAKPFVRSAASRNSVD